MSIRNAYDQWSATYDTDENLTRDLDALVTEKALKGQHYDNILEIGCGTGKNTELLAQLGKTVHAIDYSRGMMVKAKASIQAGNVFFTEADLTRNWPVKTSSVDLVVCNLVLEHLANLDFVFAEAARSLRENGTFYVSELHPCQQYQGKKANFRLAGERVEIQAFVHHVSDFLEAAETQGLTLRQLNEWQHERDDKQPPRLITFTFQNRKEVNR